MKFNVNSKELLQRLQFLSGIIGNNNSMPILDNFHFNIDENRLIVTASDLDNTIATDLKINSIVDAKICIPAKMLIDILKLLPSQPIDFEIKENNQIEIVSASGNYSLSYVDGNEFPKAKEVETHGNFYIKSSALLSAISKTLFACGQDDLRPIMNGVFIQSKSGALNFVATDSHRLSLYTRTDIELTSDVEVIMPKKPLSVLKSILPSVEEDIYVEYNQSNASFTFGDYKLTSRLIDGKYPNYEAVIPKENPNQFVISKSEFQSSLSRVSIFSNKSTHQIKISRKAEVLTIDAEDKDYSTNGKETITCEPIGNDIEIGFNASFLKEALNNIQEEKVILKTSAPNRAGVIEPFQVKDEFEKQLMLVMPVMLTT